MPASRRQKVCTVFNLKSVWPGEFGSLFRRDGYEPAIVSLRCLKKGGGKSLLQLPSSLPARHNGSAVLYGLWSSGTAGHELIPIYPVDQRRTTGNRVWRRPPVSRFHLCG